MQSHRFRHRVASLVLVATMCANAQNQVGPKIVLTPPAGPLVWTVTYTYNTSVKSIIDAKKDDLAAKNLLLSDLTRPEKVRYVIKKPVSLKTVYLEGGAKQEAFYVGDYEFRFSEQSKEVLTSDLKSYPNLDQLFRQRFPGVAWVTPKLFVKIEDAHGEKCAYFRDDNPAKVDPNSSVMDAIIDASKYQIREAWFSVQTGLPVAFKVGKDLGKYHFEDSPDAEVHVPANIQKKINEHAKYQAYLKQRDAVAGPAL
jgi:hypothetical protein